MTAFFRKNGGALASSPVPRGERTRQLVVRVWIVLTLALAALSLAPSYAHVLEAAPRLGTWPASLWITSTVQGRQFELFRSVGGPIDVAAILAIVGLAMLSRTSPRFGGILAGAICYALALVVWAVVVEAANRTLVNWRPEFVPPDFQAVRDRWERGHMAVASLKFVGFVALSIGISAGEEP